MGGAAGGLMVLLCVNTRQEETYEASCECERIRKLETDENGIFVTMQQYILAKQG